MPKELLLPELAESVVEGEIVKVVDSRGGERRRGPARR